MKQFGYIVLVLFTVAALVALGWFCGRRTADKTSGDTVSSEVLKMHMFNTAYTEVTFTEAVIEQLDSGRIDDARQMLRVHLDGDILGLDSIPESPAISPGDMVALRDLNASIQSSHGSMRESANRILARVARHRADHPWTYTGDLPHSTNAEVEAKLDSILKRASESQK
jgi:hypothetical protein